MEQMKYRKIKELSELSGNPRKIDKKQFEILVASIQENREYFEARPLILSNRTGKLVIIAGNQRFKAAKHLKLADCPTFLMKGLTEAKEKEIVIRDNVSNGEWDWEILGKDWGVTDLSDWGVVIPDFNKADLKAEEDDFVIPDKIKTNIKLGDVIEIGKHRLMCADATINKNVEILLNNNKPNLMVTDPPYGVNLDQTWRDKALKNNRNGNKNLVLNDNIADWTSAYKLFPGSIAYIWHATKFTDVIMANLRECSFEPNQMLILNKSVMVMGRSDYHWKHEPCWYAVKKGSNHSWAGDRKQTTVIDAIMPSARSQKSNEERTEHPTQKPVLAMAIPIKNHSGDVYDPFLGSGTTMVACEQLKRKCYGFELDPGYCQIIIERMLNLIPAIAVKINGKPYKK